MDLAQPHAVLDWARETRLLSHYPVPRLTVSTRRTASGEAKSGGGQLARTGLGLGR